jgi:hypothetical protein
LANNNNVELSPNKWKVVFEVCNHQATVSDEFLHKPIEQQFNPKTMLNEDVFVCPGCSADKPVRGDFCMNSVLHRVTHARKLDPHELKLI